MNTIEDKCISIDDDESDIEIQRQIQIGNYVFEKLGKVLRNRKNSVEKKCAKLLGNFNSFIWHQILDNLLKEMIWDNRGRVLQKDFAIVMNGAGD